MPEATRKTLSLFEYLTAGVPLSDLIREEILSAKITLDRNYVSAGTESPELLNYIKNLNSLLDYMNNPESIQIIDRFYKAINMLIDNGALKSKREFALTYKIEYTSFSRCEHEQESDRFQLSWISYLVTNYPVSLEWIMTGKGGMLTRHDPY